MKTYIYNMVLYLGTIFLFYNSSSAQTDYFTYYGSDTVHYTLNRDFIAVQLDTAWSSDSLFQIWDRSEWDSLPIEAIIPLVSKNYVGFAIHYPTDSMLDTNSFILRIMDSIRLRENVVGVYPVLVSNSGASSFITRTFFAKLRSDSTGNYDSTDILAYSALRDSTKTTIIQEHILGTTFDMLTITDSSTQTSLEIANRFFESGYFDAVEPNFISEDVLCTSDTYFGDQWGLKNTGQSGGTTGADIDVEGAWGITTGCPDIKTAVIDVGVDREHEDLAANLLTGYDMVKDRTLSSSNGDIFRGTYSDPNYPGGYVADNHGTPIAGIIGGITNNSKGIAGIAYTSKIVPVRYGAEWYTPNDLSVRYRTQSFAEWKAEAITVAVNNGHSDIINISSAWAVSTLVTDAINNAVKLGRNGLGTIVVAATGNSAQTNFIGYPASLQNVIAVGSTDRNDHRSTFSNYSSSEVDVVAPGEDIYTTDVMGTPGYSTGNYTNGASVAQRSGTSFAAPAVAGILALILSAQPTLTATEARYILESTCDKVGGYSYTTVSGHPNGTWNQEMGYGRVNARAAVEKAATMYIDDRQIFLYKNYFAKKKIIAGNGVRPSGTHGPVDVKELYPTTSTNVTFRASEEIALQEGFSAQGTDPSNPTGFPGTKFSAFIDDDCTNYAGIKSSGGSSAKAGLSPAEYIPPATQESSLSLSPNPVSGLLRIRFAVAATSPVHIDIVNLYGQRIATVVDGEQSQGNHNFKFDVSDLTNGMYFVQLRTSTGTVTKPIIVTH